VTFELDYGLWCRRQEAGEHELESMRAEVEAMHRAPVVSVLAVAGELDELWVGVGFESVLSQPYPRWELCAVQSGTRTALEEVLAARMPDETRVRASRLPVEPESSQAALARALSLATGDYVLVLDEGDELSAEALLRVVDAINATEADLIYSNEDRIDARGARSDPVFKPGFSPDRLLSTPDLGRLCAIRRTLVELAGGLQPALGPVAEHDLLLRVAERARRVVHLPQILYHRRVLSDANGRIVWGAPDPPPADAAAAVVEAALERRREPATARADRDSGAVRVIRSPAAEARATLILRSDRMAASMPLPHQLERRSRDRIDEVIVAGERPGRACQWPVVEDASQARAANRAAAQGTGDVLIFCAHTGTLPPSAGPRWVGELLSQATRAGVGAVSGTVVDAEGRLRHGGLRVDVQGLAGPVSREHDLEPLSAGRPINPGGASGDLLAIERSKFEAVGGFDAEHLPDALFALDLAFRLEEEGWLSLYTPVAQIVCRDPRAFPGADEAEYMWSRWCSRLNRLLDYEWAPVDPRRSPLAPQRARYATFPSGTEVAAA
jgi:O-antigen biosynthesis protein